MGKNLKSCSCGQGEFSGVDSPEVLDAKAKVIKALAHKSRLLAVEALADGEKCVCELKDLIGSGMSTVSEHLSVLKQAGIISERKDGLYVYYSLAAPCVMQFLGCIDQLVGNEK